MKDRPYRSRMFVGVIASVLAHPLLGWALSKAVPNTYTMREFCSSLSANAQPPVCKRVTVVEMDRVIPPPPPPKPAEPPPPPAPKPDIPPPVLPPPVVQPQTTQPVVRNVAPPRPQAAVHTAGQPPPVMVAAGNAPTDFDTPMGNNTDGPLGNVANGGTGDGQGTGAGPSRAGVETGGDPNPQPQVQVAPPAPPATIVENASVHCNEDELRAFFPEEAKEQGITEATVRVRISVDEAGNITRMTVLSNPGYGLADAALRGLRGACHATAARDSTGKNVAMIRTIPMTFVLE